MKNLMIRLDDKEHADLKLYCFLFGKSMNQVIKSMIARFVRESKPKIAEAMKKRSEAHGIEK